METGSLSPIPHPVAKREPGDEATHTASITLISSDCHSGDASGQEMLRSSHTLHRVPAVGDEHHHISACTHLTCMHGKKREAVSVVGILAIKGMSLEFIPQQQGQLSGWPDT